MLIALALGITLFGCGGAPVKEPVKLVSGTVSAQELEIGRQTYMLYCRACHGDAGDGKGPAAAGLRPPPRDLRSGIYKFGWVESGELPPDRALERIVRGGLAGTAMLPWDLPEPRLHAVVQYIKTFSDRWKSQYEEVGEPIEATGDPFGPTRREQAVALGKKVYHGLALCNSCHPSYATYREIYDASRELTGHAPAVLDSTLYTTELTDSDFDVKLQPPDFTFHTLRAGDDLDSLFKTIASGVGGTAMPTWKGSLPDSTIWSLAYYVRSLVAMKGSDRALVLKRRLRRQPPFSPPGKAAEGQVAPPRGRR